MRRRPVVGYPHPIKGTGIYVYVQANAGTDPDATAAGPSSRCRRASVPTTARRHSVRNRPSETRSGKIMRRILRKVATGRYDELGDV